MKLKRTAPRGTQKVGHRAACPVACPSEDSKTTVFVALNDTAVKKSVWLTRRVAVLQDASRQQEIIPLHISEKDMIADPFTKYLPYAVWDRHMGYMLNRVPE